MKFSLRNPWCILGLVVLWRVALLAFTAQPIPANDAAFFDSAMVNWYLHGAYINPTLSVVFTISGHQVYAAYPPLYQCALLVWMKLFGTTVISAMALHVALFAVAAFLVMRLVLKFFPATTNYALVPLLLLALTFDDRPEGLAHNFGLLSLLCVARMLTAGANGRLIAGLALTLFATLYTSVIVGALYFGIGFMAVAFASLRQRRWLAFAPFVLTTLLFVVVTFTIAKVQPLWWAGFQENARQTPVLAVGFRVPNVLELLKLIRTAPVFLLALALLPFLFAKRHAILTKSGVWLALWAGVFVTGWGLLVADMTLLAANYVGYILFIQLLLAAGLLALSESLSAPLRRGVRVALVGCVLLASVRAVGMTTWGAACAWKNSYARTHQALLAEFAPFAQTNAAVIVSSAFVYTALEANVKNPVHSDWYFDRANWTNNADLNGFIALQPKKLVLVQFDYYRAFAPLLERLRAQPGLVNINVHDAAQVPTPDSIPSLQRVLQQISWAPVIVDLDWKTNFDSNVFQQPISKTAVIKLNAASVANLSGWTNAISGLKYVSRSAEDESWSWEQDNHSVYPTIVLVGDAGKEMKFSPRIIWLKSVNGHARRIELRGQKMNIEETHLLGDSILDALGKNRNSFDEWCRRVGNKWLDAPEFDSGSFVAHETGQIMGFQILPTYNDAKPWSIYFVITDP